jgi:TonB-linked SusC/RagA family outer membrane protein
MKKTNPNRGRELLFKKMLRIMKLFLIILVISITQATASVYSQTARLNIKMENATIAEVFDAVEKQSDFFFFYNKGQINDQQKVTVDLENSKIDEVLATVFGKNAVSYEVIGKNIIVKAVDPAEAAVVQQDGKKISGKVTDQTGAALPGVTVVVKGTTVGITTDTDGKFTLSLPAEAKTVVFSFIGMQTQEVAVEGKGTLNIMLKQETIGLDEVVAIGYGTTKKQDLSAAVAVVQNIEKLKERPVLSTSSMIQGLVPGVTVVNQGGQPGAGASVTIRGTGSKNERVLYVVDGVPDAPYNPADVESITVLKDAASAAIYGAHAGNAGVILITTRQSKAGKPSVEYSGFYGVRSAWKLPQSLTAADEAKVSNLAYTNAGRTPLSGWDITKNPYAQVTRTDWVDEVFRTAAIQRHNITVNGGTDKLTTLFQARTENEDGTLINTYSKNVSLRFNSIYKINKYLTIKEDMFWNNNDNRGTDTNSGYTGTILSAIYMPRSATPYYANGKFGGVGPVDSQYLGIHGDAVNPVASLLRNQAFLRNSNIISTSEMRLADVVKGLEFTSRFSYRQDNSFYKNFQYTRPEPGKPNNRNGLDYSTGRNYHWSWENTINYNRVFDKHNVGLMASTTSKEDGGRNFGLTARDFTREDDWAQYLVNAQTFKDDRPYDGQYEDRNLSYVGRASYSYADRYFVTGSYRRDIAGRLPINLRAINYPGLTGAWKISSEPWFNVSMINLLKLRASWGKIGNLGSIGMYYGYPTLSGNNTYQVGMGAPQTTAAYVGSAYNADLSWETSEQTDLGLDVLMLNKKLNITADYFWKKTYDLIKQQDTKWTNTFGVSAPLINEGEISNQGFEFAANYSDKAGDFEYNVGFNFATLKNEVTYIDQNPNSYWSHGDSWRGILLPFRSIVGQPYYSYWLIKSDGIFQSAAEVTAHAKDGAKIQPDAVAGDLRFIDENKDGKINDQDRVYMGNAFPKVTYGINANVNWKNWDLSLFFQGVGGVKLFNAFKESTLNGAEQGYNRWDKILEAWSPTNTASSIPRISASDPNKNFGTISDWYLENGNYLRLKNLLVGYTFNKVPWTGALRVYFSGENLLTFTKYTGMDPEVGGYGLDGGQYPVSRVFSFGAKINF